jgi:hypothetical protein
MADKKFVKPGLGADGKLFTTPNPVTGRPLSEEGEWIPLDNPELARVVRRRLRDGDWVEAESSVGTRPNVTVDKPLPREDR